MARSVTTNDVQLKTVDEELSQSRARVVITAICLVAYSVIGYFKGLDFRTEMLGYLAVIVGYLSASPAYEYAAPGMATVKLSLSHAANRVTPCVRLTPEHVRARNVGNTEEWLRGGAYYREDGTMRAINPEQGLFGIVADVNRDGDGRITEGVPGHTGLLDVLFGSHDRPV